MNKAVDKSTYDTALFEVTHACQCSCPGCYLEQEAVLHDASHSMPLDTAIGILNNSRDYLGKELAEVHLLGGEPTLWKDLGRFIELARNRGIDVKLFTNMLGIDTDCAQFFKRNNVKVTGKLNVSPAGGEEQKRVQAKMLGGTTLHADKLFTAIQILQTAGYSAPDFRLNNVIRKGNLSYVPDYYRWCLENNITPDLELMSSGCGINDEYFELAPTSEELAKVIRKIQGIRKEFHLSDIPVLMPHIFRECDHCRRQLYFALNGDIKVCSAAGQTVLANIKDSDAIETARNSSVIQNRIILTQESVGEPCHSCEVWDECQGGCRATAESSGNPNEGYKICPRPFME